MGEVIILIHEKVYTSSNLRRIRRYRPDISGKKYIAVIYEMEGENYDKE